LRLFFSGFFGAEDFFYKEFFMRKGFAFRRMIMFLLFSVFAVANALASDSDTSGSDTSVGSQLSNGIQIIVKVLQSPWVMGVALCALIVLILGIFISHEQGTIKKFIPWIAACVLFLSAGKITGRFMKLGDSTDFWTDMTSAAKDTSMLMLPPAAGTESLVFSSGRLS
jgi:hypothetical protein